MKPIIAVLAAGLAAAAPASSQLLRGTVKQTLEAGQYTYVLVAAKEGDQWAAVPKAKLKNGETVSIVKEMTMDDYDSKILGRKFDHVIFGFFDNESERDPHAGMKAPPTLAAPTAEVKAVPKAEGPDARTVAEVYAQKAQLKGKAVVVSGQVVKANGGIMGANWLHLRDGSGGAKTKDNDITVTTADSAAVGDVVTVRGEVGVDKNLGAGYFFPVIVEKARIVK